MRGALTFSFGLCAQIPVKDAVDPLECGLSAEWLMRHRVNDVLVVGPVPGFNEISIVLCLPQLCLAPRDLMTLLGVTVTKSTRPQRSTSVVRLGANGPTRTRTAGLRA